MKERELDFYSLMEGKKQLAQEMANLMKSGYTESQVIDLVLKFNKCAILCITSHQSGSYQQSIGKNTIHISIEST